jgi:hypothetical protein
MYGPRAPPILTKSAVGGNSTVALAFGEETARNICGRLSLKRVRPKIWSRRWELNPRPVDYESTALPLSYFGSDIFIGTAFLSESKSSNFCNAFRPSADGTWVFTSSVRETEECRRIACTVFGSTPHENKIVANEVLKECQPCHGMLCWTSSLYSTNAGIITRRARFAKFRGVPRRSPAKMYCSP